ncbi:amidohydrolase family protein [Microbacterium paludicola]|nr:amidohydrolase family protein [Microbacterium paludicola]MBF0817077.1 amidohydrolase family protein [Microbacterium paludicola]
MMPVIDAHQHYWRSAAQDQPWRTHDHAGLDRDFGPADLAPALAAHGIDGTVVVQSVDGPDENDRLVAYAAEPSVAGVVGWLPVQDPDAARAELARVSIPKHVGVRCLIGRDPLEWLARPEVRTLFGELASRGLAWDVVPLTAEQTAAVVALARAVPELQIVVDHLGRPPIDTGDWDPWRERMNELATCPNVALKVSVGLDVLTAWPEWRADDIRPAVAHVVDRLGAARLMLASNWPVVTLRADHETAWRDVASLLDAHLPDAEDRARVRGGTAVAAYRLDRS